MVVGSKLKPENLLLAGVVEGECFSPRRTVAINSLTLRELAYDIFVLQFRPKKQQFLVALPTP